MKKAHQLKKQRQKIATISMLVGVALLIISAGISLVYIKPSNFKTEFKRRQLDDCLKTTTDAQLCNKKFTEHI